MRRSIFWAEFLIWGIGGEGDEGGWWLFWLLVAVAGCKVKNDERKRGR